MSKIDDIRQQRGRAMTAIEDLQQQLTGLHHWLKDCPRMDFMDTVRIAHEVESMMLTASKCASQDRNLRKRLREIEADDTESC